MTPMEYPGVAVAAIIVNTDNSKVLLGKRVVLGTGQYSLPGGKVDFGETPLTAIRREVKEETNLDLIDSAFLTGHATNDFFPEQGKHYVTLYYLTYVDAEDASKLTALEPTKIESWDWYDVAALPQPMWEHTGRLIEALLLNDGVEREFDNPDVDG